MRVKHVPESDQPRLQCYISIIDIAAQARRHCHCKCQKHKQDTTVEQTCLSWLGVLLNQCTQSFQAVVKPIHLFVTYTINVQG